jgi:hypothetical protein
VKIHPSSDLANSPLKIHSIKKNGKGTDPSMFISTWLTLVKYGVEGIP